MRAIRFLAGVALAPILALSPITGQGADATADARALPALDREALLRCIADERESRMLLERYRREGETVSASGHALDAQRRQLVSLHTTIDPGDAAAVDRYNARAEEFDARIRRHNSALAALDASRRAQQAVAQRYNAHCGGRHFQPNELRPAPATR